MERRECERFQPVGASLRYKKKGLFSDGEYTEDFSPILELSIGGVRFVAQDKTKVGTKVSVQVLDPNGEVLLTNKGEVAWIAHNPSRSYRYQVGIQFFPYGTKRGHNPIESLERIAELETRFVGG